MRLGHDADAAFCGVDEESRHRDLRADAGGSRAARCRQAARGRAARKATTTGSVCETPNPTSAMLTRSRAPPCLGRGMPPDLEFDLSVVNAFRLDLPGETEQS